MAENVSKRAAASVPHGTVTFLFTDIEGSTSMWEKCPAKMRGALARHDEILRASVEASGGYVFKTVGDAFCAAFATAREALEATLAAQRALGLAAAKPDEDGVRPVSHVYRLSWICAGLSCRRSAYPPLTKQAPRSLKSPTLGYPVL